MILAVLCVQALFIKIGRHFLNQSRSHCNA